MRTRAGAATLVELLVAVLIASSVATIASTYFHRMGRSLAGAQDAVSGVGDAQYVLRYITLRLGALGPRLVLDRHGDLFQVGEPYGITPKQRVWVHEGGAEPGQEGASLEYLVMTGEGAPAFARARLFTDGDTLVEEISGQRSVICRHVAALHFQTSRIDARLLVVDLTLVLAPTPAHRRPGVLRTRVALRPDSTRVTFTKVGS